MAKIVSLTKTLNRTRGHALEGLVDEGDLLEFPSSRTVQSDTHHPEFPKELTQPSQKKSVFASDWTNQELADLYRAYSLVQSAQPGLECDRGVSDEGDPWFLIGDNNGDVLVHICRIKGIYILDSVALPKPLRGANFNALIEDFLVSVVGESVQDAEGPESFDDPKNVVRLTRGGTVCLHPSMMIAALVWTILMNANELALPTSNESNHKGLDQGQGRDQDITLSDTPAPVAPQADLVELTESNTSTVDFSDGWNIQEISAQKDDKYLSASAYSHALTTIAIAAGFYASSEAADAFWKSFTEAPSGAPDASGETQANEASNDQATPVDHLSDALALLGSVVDLVILKSADNNAGENQIAGGKGADTLTLTALDLENVSEASIGQQMLTEASDLSKVLTEALTEAPQAKEADLSGEKVVGSDILQADSSLSLYENTSSLVGRETTSSAEMSASIQDITQAYTSHKIDVSQYDTVSFQSGLGKFNGELQKYTAIFDNASPATEEETSSDAENTATKSSYYNMFDDAARSFLDSKIENANLEVLVFEREIIFIDKAAFTGDNTSVSWELEDGGIISVIGLSTDMAEFLVA